MDPRLIELNPRIDDPMPGAKRHQMSSPADGRSPSSMTATLAGTRKQVGRWLVDMGTALEGGPARHSAGPARR
jgi:hypothetical protein